MVVEGLEDGAVGRCRGQEDHRFSRLVNRRELGKRVVVIERTTAEHGKDAETSHVTVRLEVGLELAVITTRCQVADMENFEVPFISKNFHLLKNLKQWVSSYCGFTINDMQTLI